MLPPNWRMSWSDSRRKFNISSRNRDMQPRVNLDFLTEPVGPSKCHCNLAFRWTTGCPTAPIPTITGDCGTRTYAVPINRYTSGVLRIVQKNRRPPSPTVGERTTEGRARAKLQWFVRMSRGRGSGSKVLFRVRLLGGRDEARR